VDGTIIVFQQNSDGCGVGGFSAYLHMQTLYSSLLY